MQLIIYLCSYAGLFLSSIFNRCAFSNRFLVASPGMNYPRRKIRLGMPMHDAQFIIKQVEDARIDGRITWI